MLGQYVFSLHIRDIYLGQDLYPWSSIFLHKFKSLKIKLMHDMYFDQINTWDQQNNVTQARSYTLYDFEQAMLSYDYNSVFDASPDSLSEYIPGSVVLANDTISINHPLVHSVSNDTIFINAEDITISGNIYVEPGFILVLQALNRIKLSPGATLSPKIQKRLKRDFYDTPVFEYISSADVSNFCNNSNQYQANSVASSIVQQSQDLIDLEGEQAKGENIKETQNQLKLFPNPARDLLTLRSSHLDMTSITVHDLSGRPIKQETLQAHSRETQINLSGIALGTYIVNVVCRDEVFSEKLVVTK